MRMSTSPGAACGTGRSTSSRNARSPVLAKRSAFTVQAFLSGGMAGLSFISAILRSFSLNFGS